MLSQHENRHSPLQTYFFAIKQKDTFELLTSHITDIWSFPNEIGFPPNHLIFLKAPSGAGGVEHKMPGA